MHLQTPTPRINKKVHTTAEGISTTTKRQNRAQDKDIPHSPRTQNTLTLSEKENHETAMAKATSKGKQYKIFLKKLGFKINGPFFEMLLKFILIFSNSIFDISFQSNQSQKSIETE